MKFPKNCSRCEEASQFNPGIKGRNADLTKLLFILHKSDSRATVPVLPGLGFEEYEAAFMKTQTGQVIDGLAKFCNMVPDDIYITNFFKCLLPADRNPRKKEYKNCLLLLEIQVKDFKSKKIVVFGSQPAKLMSSNPKISLGKVFGYNGVPSLVAEHPSAPWLRSERLRNEYFEDISRFIRRS
ncbi:hypothetical protein KY308_03760 [Candidatus Woesearchaeota archaeon]|nr:hypothetical protein [Candidatus Woesearchaeota archaeon]